jgi:hypothetical protein
LACLGLPWLALACLGLPWLALACLGLPWLALACRSPRIKKFPILIGHVAQIMTPPATPTSSHACHSTLPTGEFLSFFSLHAGAVRNANGRFAVKDRIDTTCEVDQQERTSVD